MKIWFDTEFIEDGKTIDLISIGMVREDGWTFYAENAECDYSRASPWVKENVIPHLKGGQNLWTRKDMAEFIVAYAGESPEFWGYYADYDWVVLCQLYGTMMDLPKGWPMFCRDVQQIVSESVVIDLPPQPKNAHNALADARWTKAAFEALRRPCSIPEGQLRADGDLEDSKAALADAAPIIPSPTTRPGDQDG